MPRPNPDQIIADAQKLKDDRFKRRDTMLDERARERFNETVINVPKAYDKTAQRPKPKILEEEGRQVATLVQAMPVPHITPPRSEDEPLATTGEKFLIAWHKELEAHFGPVWWQKTLAQVHDNIAWVYSGPRKVPYKGQPEPPEPMSDTPTPEEIAEHTDYALKNDRFKKEAGVQSWWDYRFLSTKTAHPVGNILDPNRFYEIKEVAERDLMDAYGVVRTRDGGFTKATDQPTTTPSGSTNTSETFVTVIEYWDREWCMIVAKTAEKKWLGVRQVNGSYVLAEWNHKWGRVPYFACPAIVNEQTAEEKKYTGPLDGIYSEMPDYKMLKTMGFAVAYQTAFAPLQVLTKETGDVILDDAGQPKTFLELHPGEARQLAPGQSINVIPQSPEVANLWRMIADSTAQIQRYSTAAVTRGEAPGADTANAALSNLHQFANNTLRPMTEQASRMASAMYRFCLERIRDMGERVYVFDAETDAYLSLDADDIVSVNVDAKVVPDQGQFQLLIEKHAMELWQFGAITREEMYSMWGRENPDEIALDVAAEQLEKQLDPVLMNQIISDLGLLDAVKQMMAENQQSGSARNAVPGLMDKVNSMNPGASGMGRGAPGQPRQMGVRSPAIQTTTQPQLTGGLG